MADRKTESADEAAAAYWRSVATMTKVPERVPAPEPIAAEPLEIKTAGTVTELAEQAATNRAQASTESSTARRSRRRL